MFICSSCKSLYQFPKCTKCEYTPERYDGIWQLTDDPDKKTDGEGDKYIGYEHIGESYSGNRKYIIEYPDKLFAKEISRLTGGGIFLDLACGDGCFTVPAAQNGTKVIAADISNKMMQILKRRAQHNNVSLDNVTLCRMNALEILLADDTVDCAVANSVLHLISRPERVVGEIHRVLKKGGCFVFNDDRPGKNPEVPFDNTQYNTVVNDLYSTYWRRLAVYNIYPKKYSWKFDRESVCADLFESKEEIILPVQNEYSHKLKDVFLPRFMGRGFSDQVDVPIELHNDIVYKVIEQMKNKYRESFDEVAIHGVESDIVMTIYRK